jgi:hypothetical protein
LSILQQKKWPTWFRFFQSPTRFSYLLSVRINKSTWAGKWKMNHDEICAQHFAKGDKAGISKFLELRRQGQKEQKPWLASRPYQGNSDESGRAHHGRKLPTT